MVRRKKCVQPSCTPYMEAVYGDGGGNAIVDCTCMLSLEHVSKSSHKNSKAFPPYVLSYGYGHTISTEAEGK